MKIFKKATWTISLFKLIFLIFNPAFTKVRHKPTETGFLKKGVGGLTKSLLILLMSFMQN